MMLGKNERFTRSKARDFFLGIPDSVGTEILSTARHREFTNGEVVFFAGAPAREVFLLTRGCVRITRVTENGEEIILRFDLPGDVIGSLTVDVQGPHTWTAQAVQKSKTIVWDSATFQAAIKRYPEFERNLHRFLQRQACELAQRIVEISTAKASPRLAYALVRLLNQIGRKSNGRIEIDILEESVAQMTAMSPFTLCS
jgi:CRP/FNR family transcriptional regulator, nitrogen oxide reductase regulator